MPQYFEFMDPVKDESFQEGEDKKRRQEMRVKDGMKDVGEGKDVFLGHIEILPFIELIDPFLEGFFIELTILFPQVPDHLVP